MYRAVIEHPQWIPKETQKKLDLRAGHDMGRIYRVVRVGAEPRPIPRLDRLSTSDLVKALDSPNGWQRDMAHMLLLWRDDRDEAGRPRAVAALGELALESKNPLPRVETLAVLDRLNALDIGAPGPTRADRDAKVATDAIRLWDGRVRQQP